MWGKNVLRLRRNLSTAHNGAPFRRGVSTNPVTDIEFSEALKALIPKAKWRHHKAIGLAVSGGVDSMALAALYSRLSQTESRLPTCHGIIIDHRVRPESTEEAEWVASQLQQKFSMTTSVIPLSWPQGYDPNTSLRFESDARQLRYQALGKACSDLDINSLLVAHHLDDQAETILMRLIKDRWRSGLQGMRSVDWIPECQGMHGIQQSSKKEGSHPSLSFAIEGGGIQILRPLLRFEKTSLIATCKEMGIEWAEDKTNMDPTLTLRNAIRQVMRNHTLPKAISNQALASVSVRMQDRIAKCKAAAEALFDKCPIQIQIETGSLIATFPPKEALLGRPIVTESDEAKARNVAHYLFLRIVELISPTPNPSISQLSTIIDHIYPTQFISTRPPDHPSGLTAQGVRFQPYTYTRRFDPFPTSATLPTTPYNMTYQLTGQPPANHDLHQPNTNITVPPETSDPSASSKFHFFDNRYWIRVRNHTSSPLTIRLPTEADRENFRLLHEESNSESASASSDTQPRNPADPPPMSNTRVRHYAGALRHRIPAIFSADAELIALPTIDSKSWLSERLASICKIEVRFKKIDPGQRELRDIVRHRLEMRMRRRRMDGKKPWRGTRG